MHVPPPPAPPARSVQAAASTSPATPATPAPDTVLDVADQVAAAHGHGGRTSTHGHGRSPAQQGSAQGSGHGSGHASDPSDHGWTPGVVYRVQTFCTMARLSSAMNEQASLHYQRLDRIALVTMSVLTVIASTQGADSLITLGSREESSFSTNHALRIVVALCNIACTVIATITSRFEWASKSKAMASRAAKYAHMSMDILGQLSVTPEHRADATVYLETIARQNEELQAMAEPLPLSYRRSVSIDDSIMNMWGGDAFLPHTQLGPSHNASGVGTGVSGGGMPRNLDNERGVRGLFRMDSATYGRGASAAARSDSNDTATAAPTATTGTGLDPNTARRIRYDIMALMNVPIRM